MIRSVLFRLFSSFAVVGLLGLCAGCAAAAPASETKVVYFNICEDYYTGQSLEGPAMDFGLMHDLGIDTMRISINWGDFEPQPGEYRLEWFHRFVQLAQQHQIKLRPYVCYAGSWSKTGKWNSPPSDFGDWYNFYFTIAKEFKDYPNIISYEIWNEENSRGWFDPGRADDADGGGPGSSWRDDSARRMEQYMKLLRTGSAAIRAADPDKPILLGGFTRPAADWLGAIAAADHMKYFDIVPFHGYNETWGRRGAAFEDTLNSSYYDVFWPLCQEAGKPIWVNEIGYSTLGRTQNEQANALARAVAYLFNAPGIELIGWYEIKDCDPNRPVIGDDHNYNLGITTWPDRKPKLAYHTLKLMVKLFHKQQITPAAETVTINQKDDPSLHIYRYLFRRDDGSQLLFVYAKTRAIICRATLELPGTSCTKWNLDGTSQNWSDNFNGRTISNIALSPGEVWIFEISP